MLLVNTQQQHTSISYSIISIISSLLALANYCAVPYSLTIMRIAIDKSLSKADRVLSVLGLSVITGCQVAVFVGTILQATYFNCGPSPSLILLLICCAVIVVRGLMYTLYIQCVVNNEIAGRGKVKKGFL